MAVAAAEVLTSIRPLAATKGISLDGDLDTQLLLQADRLRFKEILYNLLSNAIKFTPSGGRVWIESSVADGSVCILVGDTGIGIEPEDQQEIFESFRQVSATTKGVREGTGLGLAITKRLVEHHGGKNLGGERARQRQPFLLHATAQPAGKRTSCRGRRGSPVAAAAGSQPLWLRGVKRSWSNCNAKGSE